MMENRNKAIDFLKAGTDAGLPLKVVADLLGVCGRALGRWRLDISRQGFSLDRRKGAARQVAHKFTTQERQKVIDTINDSRFPVLLRLYGDGCMEQAHPGDRGAGCARQQTDKQVH